MAFSPFNLDHDMITQPNTPQLVFTYYNKLLDKYEFQQKVLLLETFLYKQNTFLQKLVS